MTDEKKGQPLAEPASSQTRLDSELTAARQQIAQRDKEFATLRAELALAGGFQLHVTDRDGAALFTVSRWNLCRDFKDLDGVRGFIRQVGRKA